jgi:hypothetical protein
MHLNIEQLLALRDGEGAAADAEHLATCPDCTAELERLRAVAAALSSLPAQAPERDLWPAVRARMGGERGRRRLVRAGLAAAAAAALLTIVVGVRGGIEAWHEAKTAREVRSLVAESQRLERALRTYRDDDRVVNGRTANTILDIEDRIAAVDARLGRERGDQSASRETMKLWLERVRLLDALVNLHATHVAYVGL